MKHSDHLIVGSAPRGRHLLWRAAKRTMDVIIACGAIVILFPVFIAFGLAVKLESNGPTLIWHKRVGKNGKIFKLLKFRTMSVSAMDQAIRVTAPQNRLMDDPRITRVGLILRRSSIDELPQLLNVLFGDMSLVGPRAAIPLEVEHYSEIERRRLEVRPGFTGYWQVYGRALDGVDRDAFSKMILMDIEYIKRKSLALDFAILARTVAVVFTRRGAY